MSRARLTLGGAAQAAPVFAALGDERRLDLLVRLGSSGPQSIVRLAAGTAVTRQAVTKHLRVLDAAGLVHSARRGRERIWSVDIQRMSEAGHFLDSISRQWDERLGRLKRFVEET